MLKEGDHVDLVLTSVDESKQSGTARIGDMEGAVEKLKEGQPMPTDAVLLKTHPRCAAHPDRIHAEVVYAPPPPTRGGDGERSGPARVSNPKFRSGWDAVFGGDKRLN